MKTCPGYWPDPGTPCQRILSAGDYCPKAADPDHTYLVGETFYGLDSRSDWVNVQTMSDPDPVWIRGRCKHLTPEPVEVTDPVTGDVLLVAQLCPDCDTQLETDWTRNALPAANGFERWVYGNARPDDHLVYVNGPAINKRTPVRPPWYVRSWRGSWSAFLEIWEAQKKGVAPFFSSLHFMWPLYLVAFNFVRVWVEN